MTFNRLLLAVAVSLPMMLASSASGQQPTPDVLPVFDVVSIKLHPAGDTNARAQSTGNGVAINNLSLDQILRGAYGLTYPGQLVAAPSWIQSERFDIEAKVAAADVKTFRTLNHDQIARMLLPALAERFKLAVHHESRVMPAYVLVVAKSGPKLKVATPGDPYTNGLKSGDGVIRPDSVQVRRDGNSVRMIGQGIAITRLVDVLSQQDGGRIVKDKTELTATYDFTFAWTAVDAADTAASSVEAAGPSLFTALEEQLGLKLEATKAPVDCVSVDHIEHLSAN